MSFRFVTLMIAILFHEYQGKHVMLQKDTHSGIAITVVYDNIKYDAALTSEWGFACVIQTDKDTLLFDTGSNGKILLDNMGKLKIDPHSIHAVVISHNHWDHQGGLKDFLSVNSRVTVFIPNASPADLEQEIQSKGATAVRIDSFRQISNSIFSAGELNTNLPEQSLVVRSPKGLVIITGCAHPGIVRIIEHVKTFFPSETIYLAMGGFHLKNESVRKINKIVDIIQEYGIQRIAPSHCTGEAAIEIFKNQFGEDFIESGVGRRIVIQK